MSSVKIQLFNEDSIGRYYQLAALSIARWRAPHLANTIDAGIVRGQLDLSPNDFNTLFRTLTDYLNDKVCQLKASYSPTLYKAGTGDRKILSTAGIQVEKTLTCNQLIEYFKNGVFNQRFNDKISVPMFLRAYVFSYYRERKKIEEATVSSLYLALIGIYISLVGRVRKADETYELYVNPDNSLETLRNAYSMYELLNEPRSKVKIVEMVNDLLKLEGVSLELSALLAITLYVYHVAKHVLNLPTLSGYYNVFEKFRLVCTNPGDRPLIVWERPLTLTHLIQRLERLKILDLLESIEISAKQAARTNIKDHPSVISMCINDLYSFIETNVLEPLIHCTGGLSRLYDTLDRSCREGNNQACIAIGSIGRLLHSLAEFTPRRNI